MGEIAVAEAATGLASQPKAEAPSTAASASLSSERSILTFPFQGFITFFSRELRNGRISKSPLFDSPPKRMKASGAEKAVKSARASPSISPVYSKMSLAILSPEIAASYTSLEVISSTGILRRIEGSVRMSRNSRAVRATPLAEQ